MRRAKPAGYSVRIDKDDEKMFNRRKQREQRAENRPTSSSVSSVASCSIFFCDISCLGSSLLNFDNTKEDERENLAAETKTEAPLPFRGKSERTIES